MLDDDGNPIEGTAAVVAEICRDLGAAQEIGGSSPAEPHLLLVSEGKQIVDLTSYEDARRAAPLRRKGVARVTTLGSFVDLVERFKDADSAVFACDTMTAPALVAVFDYNRRSVLTVGGVVVGDPRFGEHRAAYAFPLSDEWLAWIGFAKRERGATQAELAEWLEEHLADVLDVSSVPESSRNVAASLGINLAGPSSLVAVARELTIKVDSKVASAVNLSSGEGVVSFEETHKGNDGGRVTVPGGFVLGIPVVRGGVRYPVICRLRYRVAAGSITWRIVLHRPDVVFADSFAEAVATVEGETGLPVYYGAPEI